MELLKARVPREIREASIDAGKQLRWQSAEELAQQFTIDCLMLNREMERDLLAELSTISGGETPSLESLISWERRGMKRIKRGDPGPEDVARLIIELSQYLTPEQVNILVGIFDLYSPQFFNPIREQIERGVWNQALPQVFQDALNYSHAKTERKARQQGRLDDFRITSPSPILFARTMDFVNRYYDEALQRITSKVSIAFKAEFLGELVTGLQNGENWTTIARNVHRVTGVGTRFHWKRLVRTEMVIASQLAHDAEYQRAGIEYVFFSPNPGACPVCKPLRGYYRYGNEPREPIHPQCRCIRNPFYSLPKGAELRG